MSNVVSAREARARFAELTDRVRYTGEPIIVEKQGKPFVALVSLADLAEVERLRRSTAVDTFGRLAAQAARETDSPEPSEETIVAAVRETRAALYQERYGGS